MSLALYTLIDHLGHITNVLNGLSTRVPIPPELTRVQKIAEDLRVLIGGTPPNVPVLFDPEHLPIIRTALALHRRGVAERVEEAQRSLATPAEIASVKAEVDPLDEFLGAPLLDRTDPHPLVRVASYLTAHGRQSVMRTPDLAPEETDPKHRILLSASLLANDTAVFRRQCEDRRLPFAVVYADIDGFKKFNELQGEVYVDRFILPPILNAVEAACYGHGRAYRHGGDEFVVLLPNASQSVALTLSKQLALSLVALRLEGVPHQPRLSIGIWITHPESHLTSSELVERAALAKKHSKDNGRNRITIRVERASYYEESVHEVEA